MKKYKVLIDPEAKQDLKELYHNFPDQNERPVLFGIPFGVKDIFHVKRFFVIISIIYNTPQPNTFSYTDNLKTQKVA